MGRGQKIRATRCGYVQVGGGARPVALVCLNESAEGNTSFAKRDVVATPFFPVRYIVQTGHIQKPGWQTRIFLKTLETDVSIV